MKIVVLAGGLSPERHVSLVTGQNVCAALRERYHMEACSGMNYARSADGTTDPCLGKLLNELSADEYRHAEELMSMLERAMQG